jgi:hypothetical protein
MVALTNDPVTVPVADERLTMPTKGDLAGDQTFLDRVAKAWQDGLPLAPEAATRVYDDRLGGPHVYWAGRTPAGNAAIVLQEVDVHDDAQVPDGETGVRTAEGLVATDPKDGRLKLVSTRVAGIGLLGGAYFYKFGPEDRTMLVVDQGKPLYYSFDFAAEGYPDVGKPQWHRVQPRDGVALVRTTKANDSLHTVAYQGNRSPANIDWTKLPLDFYSKGMAIASKYARRLLPSPTFRTSFLPWKEVWQVGQPVVLSSAEEDSVRGLDDPQLAGGADYVSPWAIIAMLGDGRTIILQETQSRTSLPQLTVMVRNPSDNETTMDRVGTVDAHAVLPVKFHITNGSGGWIVARAGTALRWRLETEPSWNWTPTGREANLLPENAFAVKAGDDVVSLR